MTEPAVAREATPNLGRMCSVWVRTMVQGRDGLAASPLAENRCEQLIGARTSLVRPVPSAPMSSKRKMRRRRQTAGPLLEIVYGALPQTWHLRLPSEIRDAMPRLHALVRDDPRAAVTELRALIEREPLPMFYNWLSGALSALGEVEAVNDVVRENYRRNPHYLFARVNYAEVCIHDGDLEGAREALGAGFEIRPLLGGRKRAHISEVVGYFYAVGLYHCKAGDLAAAETVYEMLEEAAPDDPATEQLRRMLHPRLRDIFFR